MIVDGNNFISHHLKHNKSFCAGKIGGNELQLLYWYINKVNLWGEQFVQDVENVAGLYPLNVHNLEWFGNKLLQDIGIVDLMPKWSRVIPDFEQYIFNRFCPKTYVTKLQHLEPYFFENPWTSYLQDKTVLIFSPFAESIQANFNNLAKIWNYKILPNFKLKVFKYPTSIAITQNSKFDSSQDVYKHFSEILHNEKFDIGIFGTGHTGLLYAIECKKMGKSGIHLGGPTQILFGVKGSRWKEIPEFHPMVNEFWTEPRPDERPEKYTLVEGGCYW